MNPKTQETLRFIGANVRAQRQQVGLTQQQLGEAVGVELRTIQRLERGMTNVAVGTLIEIAEVLGVKPAALFKETEVPEVKKGRPKKSDST